MDQKILYGASVQAIQSFIFQTNDLKDIIGSSELVNEVCTKLFEKCLGEDYSSDNQIIAAAGKITYLFDDKVLCEKVVAQFPRLVSETAPGITVSQAVVNYNENGSFAELTDLLEKRLRIQRNKPQKNRINGLTGLLHSRQTGRPVVSFCKGDYLDEASQKKRWAAEQGANRLTLSAFGYEPSKKDLAFDTDQMCNLNNWVAVVHADGNGLGNIVRKIGKDKDKFKKFSLSLDEATKAAAQAAYRDITPGDGWNGRIPIRPIVIGGDDFTVICRGSIAMPYVASYLRHFEEETQKMLQSLNLTDMKKLTACAGIAFIKSSYPFYYGYDLAEALCSEAKKDAKAPERMHNGIAPSCLMFHKVQDSFVTNFKEIERRELSPIKGWSYKYGPYYLDDMPGRMTIKEFESYPNEFLSTNGNAIKSDLRQWMTIFANEGEEVAKQHLDRAKQTVDNKGRQLIDELTKHVNTREGLKTLPVYDILSYCSIINKNTNK